MTGAASRSVAGSPPYAGLAPATRQSRKLLNAEAKSRRENHRLKDAMSSPRSHPSAARSPRISTPERAEGKRHNAAVICLARPRCNVILAMLRTGQPYIPRNPRPPPATGPPDAA